MDGCMNNDEGKMDDAKENGDFWVKFETLIHPSQDYLVA